MRAAARGGRANGNATGDREMTQLIAVPRENAADEKRVATVPDVVERLVGLGFRVAVQTGAGDAAHFDDDAYRAAGAEIAADGETLLRNADIVFKVRAPSAQEIALMREGTLLVSFVWPAQNPDLLAALAARGITTMAMDSVPRISRAQKLDALSSMSNIAGYRAVVEAAHHFGRFFTGQVTAAGRVPPAKVFVIGAGVAGLAAIGAASGLGAIVRANDTRPEVGDQVKSMGGEFVPVNYVEETTGTGGYAKTMSEGFLKAQADVFAKQARECDIIITTALIPGKPAPKLISEEMVQSMRPGSVIVDLAAVPGEVVSRHGVTIIGYRDLPSRLSKQASSLYATNLFRLAEELCKDKSGTVTIDPADEMLRAMTVTRAGAVTWPPPPMKVAAPSGPAPATVAPPPPPQAKPDKHVPGGGAGGMTITAALFIGALLFWLIGTFAPAAFLGHFTVFVLACFVGYMVVWNVTPALHTPLMSVTNAISSIIAVGAMVQVAPPGAGAEGRPDALIFWIALVAIALTSINMFGGYAVTQRMLDMFRK
jgi:NAD(P) transhydrogenase subunit alpha